MSLPTPATKSLRFGLANRGRPSLIRLAAVGTVGAAVLMTASCGRRTVRRVDVPRDKPLVFAMNYPLYYFAERIGGEVVEIRLPVPAEVDPAYWRPEAERINQLQTAELILFNGAGYSPWIGQVTLPRDRVVNTTASARDRYIEIEEAVVHQHGPEGSHSHAGTASTTWLDFALAARQAAAVKEALVGIRPDDAHALEARFAGLQQELAQLDGRFRQVAARFENRPLLASHPVYQYLARRYSLQLRSLHWEPDETPDARQWQRLDELLKMQPARHMLWEGAPTAETRRELAKRDIAIIVFETAANRPAEGDFLDAMRRNAERLEAAVD